MTERKFGTVILAGGFGKRSELNYSKSLIKTGDGNTILEHILIDLAQSGVENVTITTNLLHYEGILKELEKISLKPEIKLLENGVTDPNKALGALGDLLFAYKKIDANIHTSFLVLPCDTTYWEEFSIGDFLKFAQSREDVFGTVACDVGDPEKIKDRFGCLVIDEEGTLKEFEEKPKDPKSSLRAVPVYYYWPKHLDLLKKHKKSGGKLDSPGFFVPYLRKNGVKVAVFVTGNNIIDAGVPTDIIKAEQY